MATPHRPVSRTADPVAGSHRQTLGRAGEDFALRNYERDGWTLLARNWRTRSGELDLIIERHDVIVFCEVKTRRLPRHGSVPTYGVPAESVTRAKQLRIRRLAGEFLAAQSHAGAATFKQIRFDVASVVVSADSSGTRSPRADIEIIEGAF